MSIITRKYHAKLCRFLPAFIAALAVSIPSPSSAAPWGPWSANSDAPAFLAPGDRETPRAGDREEPDHSIAATPFLWLLSFYQKTISPVDGDRCSLYPTCSQYGVLAVRKHGPIIGVIMTVDRLIHETDETRFAPLVRVGDRYRYTDSVADNDFWWSSR